MAENLHTVSDGLLKLRRNFQDFTQTGCTLDGKAVRTLMTELKNLGITALKNEHEINRHRWKDHRIAVAVEAGRPGTNIVLLGADGKPHPGGAA